MLYRHGAQLAAGKSGYVDSTAARGFFQLLWRWSRLRCQTSQRDYRITKSPNECRHTSLPRAKHRNPILYVSCIASQRRSNSFIPAFTTSNPENPSAKGIEPDGKPLSLLPHVIPNEYSLSTFPTDTPDGSRISREAIVEQEAEPQISHQLRTIMRFLPSSVVVLTGTVAEPGAPPTRKSYKPYRGMTLSSFSSLSLSPEPVVTFNIRVPSSTLQAITVAKQFLIHILDASVEGARVADVFTKIFAKAPVPDTPYSGLSRSPFEFGKRENYFNIERKLVSAERRGKESLIILPRLRGKGIRNVLRCEVLESSPSAGKRKVAGSIYGEHRPSSGLLRVGDHVVVLARVVEILEGAGERDRDRRKDPLKSDYGLTYADGKYLYRRVVPPSPKGNVPEKETRSSEENRPLENNGVLEGDLEEEENPR